LSNGNVPIATASQPDGAQPLSNHSQVRPDLPDHQRASGSEREAQQQGESSAEPIAGLRGS
jgi:hypothetical protein